MKSLGFRPNYARKRAEIVLAQREQNAAAK